MNAKSDATVLASGGSRTAWRAAWLLPLVAAQGYLVMGTQGAEAANAFPLSILITAVLLAITSYTDFRGRKIPNWASYPAALSGLSLGALVSLQQFYGAGPPSVVLGQIGFVSAVVGFSGIFLVSLAISSLTRGGAGDVKLAAAVGALMGPAFGIEMLAWGYVAAGAFVFGYVIYKSGPAGLVRMLGRRVLQSFAIGNTTRPSNAEMAVLGTPLAMAPFMALGALIASHPMGWTT